MTRAFENAAKLTPWADPVAEGADPTGVTACDTAFGKARARGLPLRIPAGTFLLNNPDVALAIETSSKPAERRPGISTLCAKLPAPITPTRRPPTAAVPP